MARARNIKPGFFQNDELGDLDPITRLLFIGMWTIADFKGCIEYRPKRIKAQLLPYDDCDIEQLASNLDLSGFIAIYSVQGQERRWLCACTIIKGETVRGASGSRAHQPQAVRRDVQFVANEARAGNGAVRPH